MKKIWKDEEAITLVRLLVITIVSVLIVMIGVYSVFYSDDNSESEEEKTWRISVEGDHYLIEIFKFEFVESIDEVSWSVLNLTRLIVTWEDPSAEVIRMEGDIDDVNFTKSDNDTATMVVYERFYSKEPRGNPPKNKNHTLCVVYFDDDSDGRTSYGDYIWVRPIANGGCAMEGYRFRMYPGKGHSSAERFFPPFP